jgi:hypothetical protein
MVGVELGRGRKRMKVAAVAGQEDSHSAAAPELEDLVHILQARIEARVQHTDFGERGQLAGWSMRDVEEARRSSRVLALVARMGLLGGELVAVETAAVVVKGQVVLGTLRGQQEDKTAVSTAPAVANMGVDVRVAETQRQAMRKG